MNQAAASETPANADEEQWNQEQQSEGHSSEENEPGAKSGQKRQGHELWVQRRMMEANKMVSSKKNNRARP